MTSIGQWYVALGKLYCKLEEDQCRLEFSDWLIDQGEPVLAEGQRWQVRERKVPQSCVSGRYAWVVPSMHDFSTHNGAVAHRLPYQFRNAIETQREYFTSPGFRRGSPQSRSSIYFPSQQIAEKCLALALHQLRQGGFFACLNPICTGWIRYDHWLRRADCRECGRSYSADQVKRARPVEILREG